MLRRTLVVALASAFVTACTQAGAPPLPRLVHTSQANFDPRVSAGPSIEGIRTVRVGAEQPFLVQFDGRIGPTQRAEVRRLGGRIVGYYPTDTLLVRATPAAAASMKGRAGIRAVVAQTPALRIDPTLLVHDGKTLLPSEDITPVDLLVVVRNEAAQVGVAQAVRSMGGSVEAVSASADRVTAHLPLAAAAELAARSDVVWVQKAPRYHVLNNEARWVIQAGDGSANVGKTPVWDQGLTGSGQIIGIADSGINTSNCFFTASGKILQYTLLGGATAGDEIGHGTHTSGTLAGNTTNGTYSAYNGQAKDASLYFQDASNQQDAQRGSLSGLNNLDIGSAVLAPAYNAGARIHSDSWGGLTSSYDADAQSVDTFVAQHPDMLVIFANGNAGPATGSVGSPATAKDLISVGACENATQSNPSAPEDMASFSSEGPTSDGRIKPTLDAPGDQVTSADYQSSCGVVAESGTSMATPTLAGGATLAREYFTDGFYPSGGKVAADTMTPSAALLRAVLIAGADHMTGQYTGPVPSNGQGFGRVDIGRSLYFTGDLGDTRLWVNDVSSGVQTGDAPTFTVTTDTKNELRIALVWSDPPGTIGSGLALVNNLDLEVTSPSGVTYKGNVLSNGWSVAGGTADSKNVEELVDISQAEVGAWTITVHGTSVPQGPQTFALAAVGEVVVPGQGAPTPDPGGGPGPGPGPTKCTDATVSPVQGAVGWVDSTIAQNYFTDDDIYSGSAYAGSSGYGNRYGVLQVPITVASGKTIDHITVTLTGQTNEFVTAGTTWTFDAIDMPALSASTTYQQIDGASVLATSADTVNDSQVSRYGENVINFPASAVKNGMLTIRIKGSGPQGSVMSWDSGYPMPGGPSQTDSTPGLGIAPVVGLCWTAGSSTGGLQLAPVPAQTVDEHSPLTFTLTLSQDPGTGTPTFGATGLPTGATLDASTGVFNWTPTYDQSGSYTVGVSATEGSASSTENVTITVNNVDRPPVFAQVGPQGAKPGRTLAFTVTATDPDNDTVTITAGNLPTGAGFDGAHFSWSPTQSDIGNHTVTFTASDGQLQTTMPVEIAVSSSGTPPDGGSGGTDGGTDGGNGGADGGAGADGGNGGGGNAPGCACSSTQGSPAGMLPLLFGALGLIWFRRRRAS